MFNIGSYLEKFVRLGLENQETKKVIQKAITDILGKEISTDKISYKKGVVEIKESATYKNLIFMKKDLLLKSLKSTGLNFFDIR
jgi:hypothetical protein